MEEKYQKYIGYLKYILPAIAGILIVVLLVVTLPPVLSSGEEQPRIAFVNMVEIFERYPQKQMAEQEINQFALELEAELTEILADLPREEHQETIRKYQQRISEREQELIGELLQELDEMVVEAARREDIDLVLSREDVYMGGIDLTARVIDIFEEEYEQ